MGGTSEADTYIANSHLSRSLRGIIDCLDVSTDLAPSSNEGTPLGQSELDLNVTLEKLTNLERDAHKVIYDNNAIPNVGVSADTKPLKDILTAKIILNDISNLKNDISIAIEHGVNAHEYKTVRPASTLERAHTLLELDNVLDPILGNVERHENGSDGIFPDNDGLMTINEHVLNTALGSDLSSITDKLDVVSDYIPSSPVLPHDLISNILPEVKELISKTDDLILSTPIDSTTDANIVSDILIAKIVGIRASNIELEFEGSIDVSERLSELPDTDPSWDDETPYRKLDSIIEQNILKTAELGHQLETIVGPVANTPIPELFSKDAKDDHASPTPVMSTLISTDSSAISSYNLVDSKLSILHSELEATEDWIKEQKGSGMLFTALDDSLIRSHLERTCSDIAAGESLISEISSSYEYIEEREDIRYRQLPIDEKIVERQAEFDQCVKDVERQNEYLEHMRNTRSDAEYESIANQPSLDNAYDSLDMARDALRAVEAERDAVRTVSGATPVAALPLGDGERKLSSAEKMKANSSFSEMLDTKSPIAEKLTATSKLSQILSRAPTADIFAKLLDRVKPKDSDVSQVKEKSESIADRGR